MGRRLRLGLLAAALLPLRLAAAPPSGAVVEAIPDTSPLVRTELRAGDVIVSWARLASTPKGSSAQGAITSPLEVLALEREGRAASLTIARGAEVIFVHAPPGPWQLRLTPVLGEPQRRELEKARGQSQAGAHADAGAALRRLAERSAASRRFLLAAWLGLEACRSLKEAGDATGLEAAAGQALGWAHRARQPREEAVVQAEIESLR